MPIDAVLLAGRENQGTLRAFSGEAWEALVPLAGRPMAAWVARAALDAPSVGRLAVVGPKALENALADDRVIQVDPGGGLFDNLLRGVAALAPAGDILVLSSDIPLVTGAMIEDFIQRARALQVDFAYPIIPRERVQAAFGDSRRTYVRLKEGTFTGGNLILVSPGQVERLAREAQSLIALRKSPLALARRLGVGFLIRFLLLRPHLPELERHFSRLFGLAARAVVVEDAAVGVDLDKPEDLVLFQKFLQGA